MLSMLQKRLHKDEDGFTLIELMVVVLIIAILLAIAIPTFLNAQKSAKDKSAQSELRNAITAVRTLATDAGGAFTLIDNAAVTAAEPNLDFSATAAGDAVDGKIFLVVTTSATDDDTAVVLTKSGTGKWFGAATNETGEVVQCESGGSTASSDDVNTFAKCEALANPVAAE